MIKNVLLGLILIFYIIMLKSYGQSIKQLDNELTHMSNKQLQILAKSYLEGKEYGVGWSLAAIAWKESQAGKYLVNLESKDCGVYQKNIPSYITGLDKKTTSFLVNITCQEFITNRPLASSVAVSDLLYWKKKRHNNWLKIWASYNCGYKKHCGKRYANEIRKRIIVLKRYIK